jgi:low affinity Fe/Cu permease
MLRPTRLAHALARRSPGVIGAPHTFAALAVAAALWLLAGVVFGFTDALLLVPSAVASMVALLLLVLLQYTQNRDTRALQLKLDEVIRALGEARTELLGLERRSDEELDAIESELEEMRRRRS